MERCRTKIICTIGPAVEELEKILQLIDAGMNVARLNFSHGTHEEHARVIRNLKKAREMKKIPLAIMLDTKGPEIRLGKMEGDQVPVKAKQRLLLVKETLVGDGNRVSITPPSVLDHVEVGETLLIDDGYVISKVLEKNASGVLIEIQNDGLIKSHKGVNIPGAAHHLPAMTQQDIEDIAFGCEQDVDLIAASFIRSADHVLEIKKLLAEKGKPETLVISKIESRLGVENFESILQVSDGIMVARGDLGVELPLEEIPSLQKMMIRRCYQAAKPVVTATQMLESMIKNPRPTRAEVSDVANAIFDSTSSVMLSGETAIGSYPVEAVAMMRKIAIEAEKKFNYRHFFYQDLEIESHDISSSISIAAVKTAYSSGAKAIYAFTSSGFTARLLSRFRPEMPIIALTASQKVYNQLAFNWGVIAVDPVASKNVQEAFAATNRFAQEKQLVNRGELVIFTAGSPFGVRGTTNMMMIDKS